MHVFLTFVKVIPWTTHISKSVKLTDFDDDHEWNEFVRLIQRDLRAFTTYFKNLEFTLHSDEFFLSNKDSDNREATYMFSFRHYQRCSNSKWEHWEPVLAGEQKKIQHATYSLSCKNHSDHIWLDPYFLDNRSLLRKGVIVNNFYEDGIKWYEDVWSKRLCHSIRGNIVDERKLHVEFTGKSGGEINKDKNARVYRFHGAPDLTITEKHLNKPNQCIILEMTSTSDATATSTSQSTSYAGPDAEIYGMIENSIKNEGYVLERLESS